MKSSFTVTEEAVIEYKIEYDEEKLEKLGFTLYEYLDQRYKKNPWIAMSHDTVITDIIHNQIIDYNTTYVETIDIQS